MSTIADYKKLSIPERIQLVEDIWDSIATEAPDAIQLDSEQTAELDRRMAAHRSSPDSAVPWDRFRERLFRPE